jgi:predicted amidohydrolase YtcJ
MVARRLVGRLRAIPLRSLAARGVAVSISSDNPCGPLDPLHNVRLAVTRAMPDGRLVDAREAVGPTTALRAATVGGAVSIGLPEPGGIVPGEPADLAVCDGDPFAPDTRVVETWIDGRRVWAAGETTP